MYHALLTNRYLTTRVIPLLATASVGLCVALVVIVVSVMTGFLDMVRASGHTLMGDVIVSHPVSGIPHYQRLIDRLEAHEAVAAATPIVDSWGLLRMPYPEGSDKQTEQVQIWGIEPTGFAAVTGFADSVHWRTLADWQRRLLLHDVVDEHVVELMETMDIAQRIALIRAIDLHGGDGAMSEVELDRIARSLTVNRWRLALAALAQDTDALEDILTADQVAALTAHEPRLADPDGILADGLSLTRSGHAGIVSGIHVSEGNRRTSTGAYEVLRSWWMPRFEGTLTTLPIDARGGLFEPESVILPFVNEFTSGVYLIDDTRVLVPIEVAQRLLHLDAASIVDPDDPGIVLGNDPARATMVLVAAGPGVTPEELVPAVEHVYRAFSDEIASDVTAVVQPPVLDMDPSLAIQTWVQMQARFIGPVEKERELMRTLFSIVYLVCAALVLSIFWAIVHEKTRDIGILRSLGASRGGIVWIYLRYGLVVGVIGSIAGLGLGWLVVHNINAIHDMMGNPPHALAIAALVGAAAAFIASAVGFGRHGNLLPVVLGGLGVVVLGGCGLIIELVRARGGIVMWDPEVYYFTEIPSALDGRAALETMIGAVLFSLLGAAIPAAKAADTNPVKALHHA